MVAKITKSDLKFIADTVKNELEERRGCHFRKAHEVVWRSVDAQIAMEAPKVTKNNPDAGPSGDADWMSAIQLGDLADAHEILTEDVLRLAMPNEKWFKPHAELQGDLNEETGDRDVDAKKQKVQDAILHSLMRQQHQDFGLRSRVKLAAKESLSHGSFVASVEQESMAIFDTSGKADQLKSPTLRVHSMWNCYPDRSAYIQGAELFYQGSMIICEKVPWSKIKLRKDWRNLDEVEKAINEKDEDLEVIRYYGDIFVPRKTRPDIYLPNRQFIIIKDTVVFSEENKTPFQPIIYTGYERDDVRDPYYTSPLIKRSPMSQMATHSANKFLDSVSLHTNPPIVYEQLDPHMAATGGPIIAPGTNTPARGTNNFKEVKIGDPGVALSGVQYAQQQVSKGVDIDPRGGAAPSVQLKATEVVKVEQRGDVRKVGFAQELERHCLKPFLYMQHALNLKGLKDYPFYNAEIHTPDFLRASAKDLPKTVHFDVVGSRNLLGDEQRTARFMNSVSTAASVPQISEQTQWGEVAEQLWSDSGIKDPERFVLDNEGPMAALRNEFEQKLGEIQSAFEQIQAENQAHKLEKQAWNTKRQELESSNRAVRDQLQIEKSINQRLNQLGEAEKSILEEQQQLDNVKDRLERERHELAMDRKDAEVSIREKVVKAKDGQPVREVNQLESAIERRQDIIVNFLEKKSPELAEVARKIREVK